MKKGIVMEIDEVFLTLLTPEGEFLQARRQKQSYTLGEEIHFFPVGTIKTSFTFKRLKAIFSYKPVWVFMAALVIFLGSFIPVYQNNKAYAYMSIDVNPSIELGVNKKMKVVEITGFNTEGKKVISHLKNWKKKDVSVLAQTILAEMKKEGFLNTKKQVIISTVHPKNTEDTVEKKLQKNIEEIEASVNDQKLELTVLTATEKELEKAHKLGLTTGKYKKSKIEKANNPTNNVERKSKEEQTDKKQSVKPNGHITPDKNREIVENKKITEINRFDGKSIPRGQLKKAEEERLRQNQQQPKKQNYPKEKSVEKNKSKSNEKYKVRERQKQTDKEQNNENEKNKYTKKQNDEKNNKIPNEKHQNH